MDTSSLVTVGGGPSALALLEALARAKNPPPHITVLEANTLCGLGFPYRSENATPDHTLGRTSTARLAQGKKHLKRWDRVLYRLSSQGTVVEVRTQTRATRLRQREQQWYIEVDRGKPVQAENVVLAMGHWDVLSPYPNTPGFFHSPYPLQALCEVIPRGTHTAIVGTCQTGIDTAIALARLNGRFRGKVGRVRFELHDDAAGFHLTLCSRRAFFPQVSAPIATRRGSLEHLTLEWLSTCRRSHRGRVPLDALYTRVWKELDAVGAREAITATFPGVTGQRFEDDWCSINAALTRRDPIEMLRCSLSQASAPGATMPWGHVLWSGVDIFYTAFPHLSAEDRLRLEPYWTPLFACIEAINRLMASRVLALANAGLLSVVRLGHSAHIGPSSVRGDEAEVEGSTLIDARGQVHSMKHTTDPFLQSLQGDGWIQGAQIPFAERDARPLDRGGIFVDPESYRVIPPPETDCSGALPTLFAMGPLTIGQFPQYVGLLATRIAAAKIAEAITG